MKLIHYILYYIVIILYGTNKLKNNTLFKYFKFITK